MPELRDRPIVNVPIGFDRDDFPPAEHVERDDGMFRIVHTGTMHTELGLRHRAHGHRRRLLGGTSVDVDILTRSPVFLLRGGRGAGRAATRAARAGSRCTWPAR